MNGPASDAKDTRIIPSKEYVKPTIDEAIEVPPASATNGFTVIPPT